ncbi:hypothetical protein ACI797_16390 [Geodermatophilus sp. SYSU D00691]
MPPVAAVLAAVAALLETTGLAVCLLDVGGNLGRLLSMDQPGSLARLFVAGVLLGTAVVAVVAAVCRPGRRGWWSAVASIAALLGVVKLSGELHVGLVHLFSSGAGVWRGAAVLGVAAVVGLVALWSLGGEERRVRRWLVLALAAHAVAAIGLSAVSTYARLAGGPVSAAFATFVEESAEALTASGILVAVLMGVLPRRTVPAATLARRGDDDAHANFRPLAGVASAHAA